MRLSAHSCFVLLICFSGLCEASRFITGSQAVVKFVKSYIRGSKQENHRPQVNALIEEVRNLDNIENDFLHLFNPLIAFYSNVGNIDTNVEEYLSSVRRLTSELEATAKCDISDDERERIMDLIDFVTKEIEETVKSNQDDFLVWYDLASDKDLYINQENIKKLAATYGSLDLLKREIEDGMKNFAAEATDENEGNEKTSAGTIIEDDTETSSTEEEDSEFVNQRSNSVENNVDYQYEVEKSQEWEAYDDEGATNIESETLNCEEKLRNSEVVDNKIEASSVDNATAVKKAEETTIEVVSITGPKEENSESTNFKKPEKVRIELEKPTSTLLPITKIQKASDVPSLYAEIRREGGKFPYYTATAIKSFYEVRLKRMRDATERIKLKVQMNLDIERCKQVNKERGASKMRQKTNQRY